MVKKKIIVGAVALTLLAGTGTGVYAYNQKVQADEEIKQEQLRVKTLENAENAVDSLYDSNRTRLSDDIQEKIKKAEVAVEKVEQEKEKTKLSKEISEVKEIAKIQQEVYSTLENGVLVETLTSKQLDELNQKLSGIKSKNEPIYTHLIEYLNKAKAQLATIDEAAAKVTEAEKLLNRTAYNSALSLVNKVENEVKKTELNKRLASINEKLIALEEETKRKKEEETKIAAAKVAVEKETETQIESNQQKAITSKNSKPNSSTSNKSSNKSTSSTKNSETISEKSSSSTNSNRSSSSSKSTSNNNKSSSSSKSSSNTSKNSNTNKSVTIDTSKAKKTGEGKIKNHTSEDQSGASTYEEWTIDGVDTSIFEGK